MHVRHDFDKDPAEFSQNLFGYNPNGLAFYIEPEGWKTLCQSRSPRENAYLTNVPQTTALAHQIYAEIPQRMEWAVQLPNGSFVRQSPFSSIRHGRSLDRNDRSHPGRALTERDIAKHLLGRTFSIATTDIPQRIGCRVDPDAGGWAYNLVSHLAIDTDQKGAWCYRRERQIWRELEIQRIIVEDAGFTYSVFKTGSKGIQAVIPLPSACTHSVASFILGLLRIRLAEPKRWNPEDVVIDADNLHSVMRLPGGIHSKFNETSLWIDLDNSCLYLPQDQIGMMVDGYRWNPKLKGVWTEKEFTSAAADLEEELSLHGISPHMVLNERDVRELLPKLSASLITRVLGDKDSTKPQLILPATSDSSVKPDPNQTANSSPQTLTWAQRTWDKAFKPGEFWDWINMGGKRGILAAAILFGESEAEAELLALVRRIQGSTDDIRKREDTVRSLWRTFDLKKIKCANSFGALQPISDEASMVAKSVVEAMLAKQPKPRWNPALAEQVATIIISHLEDSHNGWVDLSVRDIAIEINARWPNADTNHARVAEMLERLCGGKGSVVSAFIRGKGVSGLGKPDCYHFGAAFHDSAIATDCRERAKNTRIALEMEEDLQAA